MFGKKKEMTGNSKIKLNNIETLNFKQIKDYDFVVGIKIKNKTLSSINYISKKLDKKYKINYLFNNSVGPHITLTNTFKLKKKIDIKKIFFELKKIRKKNFLMKFKNLSIFFGDTPAHVLRWQHNQEIIALKNSVEDILMKTKKQNLIPKFERNIEFIAKTTVAYKDTNIDNLEKISKLLRNSKLPKICEVDNICLYGCRPYIDEIELFQIKLKKY